MTVATLQTIIDNAGSSSFAGDGTSGIYLWGAQLEQSSTVGEYIPTTSTINSAPRFDHAITSSTTNLILWSQVIRLGEWTNQQATTQTINQATAPDDTTTATTLTENTQSANRFIAQTIAVTNAAHTFSVFVKIKERKRIMLRESSVSGAAVTFDASTATVVGTESGATGAISSVGNGWYRCSMTHTPSTVSSRSYAIYLMPDTGTSFATSSYTGDGTSGIYLWGAQIEQSATVGPYVPTTTAAATSNTTESLGLLVEEARTNSIRNNTMVGAVAGTPGTNPTNWFAYVSSGTGVSTSIISTGTDNGVNYVDIRFNGTPSANAVWSIITESAGIIPAATGQVWTYSAWIKIASGSNSNVSNPVFFFDETVGSTFVTGVSISTSFLTSTLNRYPTTYTLTGGATVNRVNAGIRFSVTSGQAIDITLRIGLPQLEQGAFATSVIPTTTATVTRAADVASITGSNFGTTRTNLLLRSEEFNDASWVKFRGSIAPNAETAPSGTLTADKLVEDTTATNTHGAYQSVTVANGAAYTFSCYIKAGERTSVSFRASLTGSEINAAFFNLSTGVVLSTGSGYTATITSVGANWYRCSVTATSSVTSSVFVLNTAIGTNNSYTGDGTSGIYLWGAMLETGSTATAYIPTTTAAVSVFESSWYNQTEGTVFEEVAVAANSFATYASIDNGTTAQNSTYLDNDSGNIRAVTFSSNTAVSVLVLGAVGTAGLFNKLSSTYKVNDFAAVRSGGTVQVDTSGAVPVSPIQLCLGRAPSGLAVTYINGTIKRLTYWPTRLANTTLQQITQP
jgi:hypothetical protein